MILFPTEDSQLTITDELTYTNKITTNHFGERPISTAHAECGSRPSVPHGLRRASDDALLRYSFGITRNRRMRSPYVICHSSFIQKRVIENP